jgi:hypothetical protein
MFGDAVPGGQSPVNVSGIFYSVADATQPEPDQTLTVSVFGYDASSVPDEGVIGLVAGPVFDRNGNPVADGTAVTFTLTKDGGAPATATGNTVDGLAGTQIRTNGAGSYVATASVAGITASPLTIGVVPGADGGQGQSPSPASSSDGGGVNAVVLALAIGIPSAGALAAGVAVVTMVIRRNRRSALPLETQAVLRIDGETRRVYVNGVEAKPPLSNEQYRLLHYLYERSGKVIARDELIAHVWPDDHAEGVSEEALDALVRRVRERIVQAGGERSYIVTLRGQGFRLEI